LAAPYCLGALLPCLAYRGAKVVASTAAAAAWRLAVAGGWATARCAATRLNSGIMQTDGGEIG